MLCFFCSSDDHVTQYCYNYLSNEARQNILRSKNCCQSCLTQHSSHRKSCDYCYTYRKCYICFSRYHHTVFCPDRFEPSNALVPNIDMVLLPRFMQFLSTEEKYSLFLSSSINPDFVKLKPFKVKTVKTIEVSNTTKFTDIDFWITQEAIFDEGIPCELFSKKIVFRSQNLTIEHLSLSSDELLQIISFSKTKALSCRHVTINPTVTIIDIFKNAPNLEYVLLLHSNIEITNSWPDDLLQYATNLKELFLSIPDINFNVESLAALMKERTDTISLHLPTIETKNEWDDLHNALQNVTNKISKYFTSIVFYPPYTGLLVYIQDQEYRVSSKKYLLK